MNPDLSSPTPPEGATARLRYRADEIERKISGTRKAYSLWAIWDWDRRAYVNSGTREEMEREAAALNGGLA